MINLIIIMATFHIHKCKCMKEKESMPYCINEIEQYNSIQSFPKPKVIKTSQQNLNRLQILILVLIPSSVDSLL